MTEHGPGGGKLAHSRHSNGAETMKSSEHPDVVSDQVAAAVGTLTTAGPGSSSVIRLRDSRICIYQPSFNLPYC